MTEMNLFLWQIKQNKTKKKNKKYTNFRCKLGKLAIQIKDDYYINWKNAQIGKFFNNFS